MQQCESRSWERLLVQGLAERLLGVDRTAGHHPVEAGTVELQIAGALAGTVEAETVEFVEAACLIRERDLNEKNNPKIEIRKS